MEQFAILRLNVINRTMDDKLFDLAIQDLKHTKYDIGAKQENAPGTTHCISAVRYIIQKSTGIILPRLYIGDFCRTILESHPHLDPQILPISHHERGDFIFLMKKSVAHKAYMITHIGIFTDNNRSFFHSNWTYGGQQDSIDQYEHSGKIATCKVLGNYTDPRRIK